MIPGKLGNTSEREADLLVYNNFTRMRRVEWWQRKVFNVLFPNNEIGLSEMEVSMFIPESDYNFTMTDEQVENVGKQIINDMNKEFKGVCHA